MTLRRITADLMLHPHCCTNLKTCLGKHTYWSAFVHRTDEILTHLSVTQSKFFYRNVTDFLYTQTQNMQHCCRWRTWYFFCLTVVKHNACMSLLQVIWICVALLREVFQCIRFPWLQFLINKMLKSKTVNVNLHLHLHKYIPLIQYQSNNWWIWNTSECE